MSLTFWTNQQLLQQLDSGAHWTGDSWSYGFPTLSWDNFTTANEQSGFISFNSSQIEAATLSVNLWDDLISPNFSRQFSANGLNTQIEFGNSTSGVAFAHAYYPTTHPAGGGVWLNPQFDASQGINNLVTPQIGKHGFVTYIHEIGHALGLRHMGNYNGSGTTIDDRTAIQDDTLYSVMSYFDPWETGSADWRASDGQLYSPQTPMLNDILAIQTIYGADITTRTGDTIYGFGSNISGDRADIFDFNINLHPILTICDAGGIDTLNLSGFSTPSIIDLEPGAFSSADAMTFNIAIANNTFIENTTGGSGNDTLTGNLLNNVLKGKGGNDALFGGGGDDRLNGGAGSDTIDGGDGSNDVAVFSGQFSTYSIVFTPSTSNFTITNASGSQVDVVTGVELFEFADVTKSASELGQGQDVTVSIAALSASQLEGNGGLAAFTFNVALSQALSSTQIVSYGVSGTGANAADGADFSDGLLPSGTVTFTAGQTSQNITVFVAGDAMIESDEIFAVSLSSLSSGIKLGTASAIGTIGNDDTSLPLVSIVAATESQLEGNSGTTIYTFNVSLSQVAPSTQTVSYNVSGSGNSPTTSTDFANGILPSGVLTFMAGDSSETITVSVVGDPIIESDETFTVTLSNLSAGLILDTSTALGRILDDDTVNTDGDDYSDNTSTAGFVSINGAATSGRIEVGLDSDWFRVNLTAGQTYIFDLTSTVNNGLRNPLLNLYDGSGVSIAENDDGGTGLNSQLVFTAPNSGTFFLGAEDANVLEVGTGDYTISAVSTSGSDDFKGNTLTAGVVSIDGAATSGDIEVGFDSDWFRVNLTAGQTYTFELTRTGDNGLIDPYLNLYDGSGEFITFNDDSGGDLNSRLTFTGPTSGVFFLGAEDFSVGTGAYTISASTASDADDFTDNTSTTGSVSINGAATSGEIEVDFDSDWFRVDLIGGQTYTFNLIRTDSNGLSDPFLLLFDGSGAFIDFDDDSGGDLNSRLTFTAPNSVAFFLAVEDFSVGTGAYTISAITATGPDDFRGNVLTMGFIAVDGAVAIGEIETTFDNDWFRVDLIAGQTYTFNLGRADSNGLSDPFLSLFDSTGAFIDFDDDSGGGLNSQLTFTAPNSATFFLGAEDFSVGTGAYIVSASLGLMGTFGDDKLKGGSGADIFDGRGGNDTLIGRGGNDILNGDEGDDILKGGTGRDTLSGGDGNDTLKGGGGADTLSGDDGDDKLNGGRGADVLNGGAGNDILEGHKGTDTLDGGEGSDTYTVFKKDVSADIYNDTGTGNGDIDTLDASKVFSAAGTGLEVILGENTRIVAGGTDAVDWDFSGLTLLGIKQLRGTTEGDSIVGSGGADKLLGLGGADDLTGGDGQDVLKGGAGDDVLNGNTGDDLLKGGGGSDTLIGGTGNDELNGGKGTDTFVFDSSLATSNIDSIINFESMDDVIALDADIFTSLTSLAGNLLSTNEFKANETGRADEADDRIIYNINTGDLFYDADGAGGEDGIKFAQLTGAPSIDADDFIVIA